MFLSVCQVFDILLISLFLESYVCVCTLVWVRVHTKRSEEDVWCCALCRCVIPLRQSLSSPTARLVVSNASHLPVSVLHTAGLKACTCVQPCLAVTTLPTLSQSWSHQAVAGVSGGSNSSWPTAALSVTGPQGAIFLPPPSQSWNRRPVPASLTPQQTLI